MNRSVMGFRGCRFLEDRRPRVRLLISLAGSWEPAPPPRITGLLMWKPAELNPKMASTKRATDKTSTCSLPAGGPSAAAAAVSQASSAAVWELGLVCRCQLHKPDTAEPTQPLCCSELVGMVVHAEGKPVDTNYGFVSVPRCFFGS